MSESHAEDFRELARTYAALHFEITNASKSMRDLKKQKDGIGEHILRIMKENTLDECVLPDGAKITRKISKRTGTLKKELILAELVNLTGDEAKAANHLNNILSKREIVEKDVIACNLPKA